MSAHRVVNPGDLAEPKGFSHAVVAAPGRTVYLAGQTALDGEGRVCGESMVEQLDVAAGNIVRALAAAGGRPQDVVSLQIFVTDVGEYRASLRELGRVWARHFGRHYPAMALFEVSALFDPGARVELMGVAVVPEGS
jgi:enamine deaminase RidA (YjgF/YER057c/UK114 family)